MVIAFRAVSTSNACPECGANCERIHSRYRRRLADLPMAGRPVRLVVVARRFHCNAVLCGRRIFVERFAPDVLAPWARRTARLDHIVHHLGLALGGRPAASFARRLMLPVSKDTLLRVVRRRGGPRFVPPTVIGIDDWAWRRNKRYGTIISISNAVKRSRFCRIANRQRHRIGSQTSRRSRSSRMIEAAATLWQRPRRCRERHRSPTGGT